MGEQGAMNPRRLIARRKLAAPRVEERSAATSSVVS
jgi:hypothetical protein